MIKTTQKKLKMQMMGVVVIAASFALFSAQSYAQAANQPTVASGQEQKVTVAFDNADVKDVIRWASDLTTKNIIVHPGVAGKKITIVAGEPMTREEAWQVFLSALQVNGLAVVESGDTVKVIPEPDAKTEQVPVVDGDKKTGKEDIVVRIVKVKNLAAQQLISLIKPLTPNSAHLAAYPENNTLVIADRAGNIDQIVDIINRIDKAGTVDVEIMKLEFASAKDVVKTVTDLMQKTGAPKGGAAPPGRELNITADERSNSILMTGDPVLRAQMHKLIQRLDLPLSGDGNTQVVYLNYITAKDMLPILEGVGSNAKGEAGKSSSGGAQDVAVNVQALEQTNAIVITAPPSMMNTMKGVIAKLDVRRQQVLVEALIVEVSEDLGRDLGVYWEGKGNSTAAVGLFGTQNAPIQATDVAGKGNLTLGGLSLGVFSGGDLVGLVRALEKNSNANVLSTPTVIALDNEEAKILVGESVPFKTGSEQVNNTPVIGNNTVTNTGGISNLYNNNFVQIERKDIGVELTVTPRINQEGILTLEVQQKVESIDESANVGGTSGAADIITNKREIKTKALVKDNSVLVLGGLIRDEIDAVDSGVPYLSKIPYLGRLFKGTSKHVVKKNLMVFIHPRILHDDADIAEDSSYYYNNIRNSQKRFNKRELDDTLHLDRSSPELSPWQPPRTGTAGERQAPFSQLQER